MPPKANRNSKSSKSSLPPFPFETLFSAAHLSSDTDPDPLYYNAYHTKGWAWFADILCRSLDLPDVTTKSGLKKVHKDFNEINAKLINMWDSMRPMPVHTDADYRMRDRTLAAVICAYTKMCIDSVLCERIFREADLLDKVIFMLDSKVTMHAILQCLITVTHHGSLYVRTEISRKAEQIIGFFQRGCWNIAATELAFVALTRCIASVLEAPDAKQDVDPPLFHAMRILNVLVITLGLLKEPKVSPLFWKHGTSFISILACTCSDALKIRPSSINLLVALSRSPDLRARATGVLGVQRMYIIEQFTREEEYERNPPPLKPKLSVLSGQWPARIKAALKAYPHPSETDKFNECRQVLRAIVSQMAPKRDLATLGYYLACIVTLHNVSLALDLAQPGDLPIPKHDLPGLTFTGEWDVPPECATALRARNKPTDSMLADILDVKRLIMEYRSEDSQAAAREALVRSPDVAYFYYVLTLGDATAEDGVRAARKGLRCYAMQDPHYLRWELLHRAAEHGCEIALERLTTAGADERVFQEGFAAARFALEDAETYLREAPPDARNMGPVAGFYTLMLLVSRGHELKDGLPELKDANDKFEIATEWRAFVGSRKDFTPTLAARETLLERMDEAQREWGAIVRTMAKRAPGAAEFDEPAALARWLETLTADDPGEKETPPAPWRLRVVDEGVHAGTHIPVSDVLLGRCSWCGAQSAVLRRCSGCQQARYCDAGCQKRHWTGGHRKTCKKVNAARKE
ncbi:hypothetical protein BC834DRAFT_376138 [Gloeopeniophorella convolvens]|nr:hypothetical protein BC834DRAFT_376138 [Gloeopeniophorella convolvens]